MRGPCGNVLYHNFSPLNFEMLEIARQGTKDTRKRNKLMGFYEYHSVPDGPYRISKGPLPLFVNPDKEEEHVEDYRFLRGPQTKRAQQEKQIDLLAQNELEEFIGPV